MTDEGRPGEKAAPDNVLDSIELNTMPPIVEEHEVPYLSDGQYIRGDRLAEIEHAAVPTLPFLDRPGYLLRDCANLIVSYPKVGKSTLLAALVPEWVRAGKRVLILSEERFQQWVPRAKPEDADLWARVRVVEALGLGFGLARESYKQGGPLLEHARRSPEEIVVVDTLRNVLGLEDETGNSKLTRQVNPWVMAMRGDPRRGDPKPKTLVALSHQVKDGGPYGRSIAGGHALLGTFDAAIEIDRVPGSPNRRRVTLQTRHPNPPPELLYERSDDGSLLALGDAALVSKGEVGRRALEVLEALNDPSSIQEVRDAFDDPRPGVTVLREVLGSLAMAGKVAHSGGGKRGDAVRYSIRSPIEGVANESNPEGSHPVLAALASNAINELVYSNVGADEGSNVGADEVSNVGADEVSNQAPNGPKALQEFDSLTIPLKANESNNAPKGPAEPKTKIDDVRAQDAIKSVPRDGKRKMTWEELRDRPEQ